MQCYTTDFYILYKTYNFSRMFVLVTNTNKFVFKIYLNNQKKKIFKR